MSFDIITLFLVFALVFCFLPASVWADALDELPSESTEPTAPVYLDVIERSTSSIFHATLFGAFLICGTLVGLHLLRGRYGT